MSKRNPIFNYDNTKYHEQDCTNDVSYKTVVLKYNAMKGYAVPGGRYVSRARAEILAQRLYEATQRFECKKPR